MYIVSYAVGSRNFLRLLSNYLPRPLTNLLHGKQLLPLLNNFSLSGNDHLYVANGTTRYHPDNLKIFLITLMTSDNDLTANTLNTSYCTVGAGSQDEFSYA